MKRKIALLLTCLMLLMQISVFSYGAIEYGDSIKLLRMTGVFPNQEFWNMYSGREACEFSSEQSYRGGTSLKVDVDKIKASERQLLNFETQKAKLSSYDADRDSLCFEWYLYGVDTDIFDKRIVFSVCLNYADGTQNIIRDRINFEKADKGWVRVWILVPKGIYGDAESCTMGILYNPNKDGAADIDCFYLDEMAIRLVPGELETEDITAENSANLELVRVFGIDCFGNRKLINLKSKMNWSVVSGNAVIDENSLIYNGKDDGQVVVRCEFYGVSTEFTVNFRRKISYTQLNTNADGSISVVVQNKSDNDTEVELIFALYDGERLYDAQTMTATVAKQSETQLRSKPVKISGNIKKPIIKIYRWDSLGGMSVIK